MPIYADVAATPPKGPGISLLDMAILPDLASLDGVDAVSWFQSQHDIEKATSGGSDLYPGPARWTGGFEYAPENQYAGVTRDPCDSTSEYWPALPAPAGLAGTPSTSAGTLTAATYHYAVTAVNAAGETLPCTSIAVVLGATGEITLTWNRVPGATGYNVYGRSGTLQLMTPSAITVLTFVDTGAVTPSGAEPASNTTAGPGTYGNEGNVKFIPYLVMAQDECSSWGWESRDFEGRAKRRLMNALPGAIEAELWTGAYAKSRGYNNAPNNYLANSADAAWQDLTPGTVPSVARGLQILEDALAITGYGGQGMIHCQAQTVPTLLAARRVDKKFLTLLDNLVVPGTGYPGTAPDGGSITAGQAYIYATDLVSVRVDPVIAFTPDSMAEALDRGDFNEPNRIRFWSQCFAAATWDGYRHFGCKVSLES